MTTEGAKRLVDEQRDELCKKLEATGLDDELVAQALEASTEAIAITPRPAKKADREVGATRLGGPADLPEGAWPTEEGYELKFLGQFALGDLVGHDPQGRLPDEGLLSFFVGHPTDFDADPEPIGRVLFTKGGAGLVATGADAAAEVVGVDLAPAVRLPAYGSGRFGDHEAYRALYDELYLASRAKRHGFFEQDRRWERAVEPGEVILLRLDADRDVPYEFFEVRALYFIVAETGLAEGDFSKARVHEGSAI